MSGVRPNANEIPKMLLHRLLSIRIYNKEGMMIDACTVQGKEVAGQIQDSLSDAAAAYIDIHNSGPGCYNYEVVRV